jgi:REP element-mobilizing transposase RayT
VEDHVHILVGLKATHRLSDVMRELKKASSKWVHEEIGLRSFRWQEGYGAFTVSERGIEAVRRYIARQEEHHRVRTFRQEYIAMLRRAEIEFEEGDLEG